MLKTRSTFLKNSVSKSSYCVKIRGIKVNASLECDQSNDKKTSRRELVLKSINGLTLAALLRIGAAPRPKNIGVKDFGNNVKSLSLCPLSPNCVATSEVANDPYHYVPPLVYNPKDGRGGSNPVTQDQAMAELVDVIKTLKPDNFTPKIINQTSDYLYAEYESPTFGFIDDVEFWFPEDEKNIVEYRSASRVGESDGNINRKRIKAIRLALEKKGWASAGF